MRKNIYGGKFIVFEGIDGSGHTTQANLLRDFLLQQGKEVLLTKEPTLESEAGKRIHDIVVVKTEKASPQELQALFVEDRKEHLAHVIIPALQKGMYVISDRYFFSTIAYGAGEGVDEEWLINQNKDFLYPDSTFLLKVNPIVCVERIQKRGKPITIFEYQEKLEKIWRVYEKLAQRFENVVVVNGELPIEEVSREIQKDFL